MGLLNLARTDELDLETETEREIETDRQVALRNEIMVACRGVVRELGGYDQCAAALSHVWGGQGRSVTAPALRATLNDVERNYFRFEWIIWFATQSERVRDLMNEIGGTGKPKKTPEEELADLKRVMRKKLGSVAEELIRKAESP